MFNFNILKILFQKIALFLFLIIGSDACSVYAFNYQSNRSGNWNNASTWSPNGVPSIGDNVTIRSGHIVTLTENASCNSITLTGIESCLLCLCGCDPSELRLEAYTLSVGGSFTNDAAFVAGTGTVMFTGAGTINGSSDISFYRLTINTNAAITLIKSISISNRLTMTDGIFNTGTNTLSGTGGITATGGILKIAKTGVLVPELTGTYTITGGTLSLNGIGSQTIKGGTYFKLVLDESTGTKTLDGNIILNGDLTIGQGTLDVSLFNYGITIGGNWTNNGSFNPRNGTITFNGTTSISGTGDFNFNHIVISGIVTGHSGNINLGGTWTNNGNYIHNNGTITFNGVCTVNGTAITTFNHLKISALANLIGHPTNVKIAGNLTNDGIFIPNNGTITFTGTNVDQLISDPATFNHVIINSTKNIILNAPISINGSLTLTSGKIVTTAQNMLTLNSGASTTLGNATSYVNGPMIYTVAASGNTVINLPIGKDSAWRPAILSVNHNSAMPAKYTAEVFNSSARDRAYTLPAGITKVSNVRFWRINRENVSNLNNATVQLYYGEDDGVTDSPNLRILKTISSDLAWYNVGGSGTANGTGSITSDPFTSFSDFTPGNEGGGGNALPIELLDFDARSNRNIVEISWSTATEINNDFFTVERTADGENFETVSTINGAGNSNFILNYTITDEKPLSGISYYRLKQTDFDGKYVYAGLASVNIRNYTDFNVYPNPSNGSGLFVKLPQFEKDATLGIYDINGKMIFSKVANLEGVENQTLSIEPESRLKPGVYIIIVKSAQNSYQEKLIVN